MASLLITARKFIVRACVIYIDSVIFDAGLPCARTSRRFSSFSFSRAQVQGRIEHVVRVCACAYYYLKSRALTTITQRIERDVKNSGIMQQYSGTPGV